MNLVIDFFYFCHLKFQFKAKNFGNKNNKKSFCLTFFKKNKQMNLRIVDLLKKEPTQNIQISGWVRSFRGGRFIALNDGSCMQKHTNCC